ncbi:MAG: NADH-quinone oxidoreductase subunit 5 family protein [Actinomycetes bacterium]
MTAVYLAVLAPFLAALVGFFTGRRWPRTAVPVAVTGASLALLGALVLAVRALDVKAPLLYHESAHVATVPTGRLSFGIDLRVDGLAALVALAVAIVALAVQVYSSAYLKGDPRYSSYGAFVSLFTAAMMLVVFADDLFVLLVGWEVMGVCSYFLIGHHWEQEGSRQAAVKAFVVTRLGDVGFLFGIFVLGTAAGTFRISRLVAEAPALSEHTATVGTLLLLCGVVGKSAQFPLHVWLPDAMAGPTPISALIHAATMVAAGIYLVARLYPVFLVAPTTLSVMAVIACVTMLGGALAAVAQDDIKRVLAYSTVSQLAYMLAALSVGSATAASFHLLTHAAFKALLFLAAGSVIHAVGTNLMPDMGGLRRAMPVTFVTMTIGLAALAGLPPFSGFFSKEAVLGAAEEAALHDGPAASWAGWLVLVVGLVTVAVTAAYVTRLWLMTFFDVPRGGVAAHESSPAMSWPLVVLAVPSALIGFVGLREGWLPRWLGIDERPPGAAQPLPSAPGPLHIGAVTSVLSVVLALAGFTVVLLVWRRAPWEDPSLRLVRVRPALVRAFYLDELYDRAFVRPVWLAAQAVRWTDDDVIGAAVRDTGTGTTRLAGLLRRTQRGNVQVYLTGLLAGVVIIAVGVVTLT